MENYPSITFEEDIKGEWAKAGVQFRLGFIGKFYLIKAQFSHYVLMELTVIK